MPRLTVTFDEDLYAWIEDEADARDRSKSWIVTEAVRAARADDDRITSDHRTDDHRPDDQITDLVDVVEELADRVEDLERAESVTADESDDVRPRETESIGDGSDTGDGTDGVTDSPPALDDSEHPDAVVTVVDDVAANWQDTDARIRARKAAARAVLSHALDTGEAIGKSDAEEFHDDHPVEGQSFETWWRKNIRPVLKEAGAYSQGQHGYVVDALE